MATLSPIFEGLARIGSPRICKIAYSLATYQLFPPTFSLVFGDFWWSFYAISFPAYKSLLSEGERREMGGCASKPMELKGEMDPSLIQDKHGEKVVKEAVGGQQEQENAHRSLGFLLKELEDKEAEESKAEHPVEGSEGATVTIVPDAKSTTAEAKGSMEDEMVGPQEEDMELPVSSLVNAAQQA